jgi:hypothetical protein
MPIERSHEPSVNDLEIRLDTGRTIDLFSMNPKVSGACFPFLLTCRY